MYIYSSTRANSFYLFILVHLKIATLDAWLLSFPIAVFEALLQLCRYHPFRGLVVCLLPWYAIWLIFWDVILNEFLTFYFLMNSYLLSIFIYSFSLCHSQFLRSENWFYPLNLPSKIWLLIGFSINIFIRVFEAEVPLLNLSVLCLLWRVMGLK